MKSNYQDLVKTCRKKWLVTGAAGFIGSHLVEFLLKNSQDVRGLDNFSTGSKENLKSIQENVGNEAYKKFEFIEGDIVDPDFCQRAVKGVDLVLHQAALGSVPRSIQDPLNTHRSNVDGFIHMLKAAVDNKVSRFVYASSSSVYGDNPDMPKVENKTGNVLSPYAASKAINEVYAQAFFRSYGLSIIGLRYFNVFGPRQNPNGPYAAVIPRWIENLMKNQPVQIFGDGETSRDFCFVNNAVQANLLSALTERKENFGDVFNVSVGSQTSLTELYKLLAASYVEKFPGKKVAQPTYTDFRAGDIRHTRASTEKVESSLGFSPTHRIEEGIKITFDWYADHLKI